MAKKTGPLVKVWGIQKLGSSQLKQFDFSPGLTGDLWAYPVFTSHAAAIAFAEFLTEDATGPGAEEFRRASLESVRLVGPREIPRAATVMVDCTALRDARDNTASMRRRWGEFYDEQVAELN